jgi:hypothetical protein
LLRALIQKDTYPLLVPYTSTTEYFTIVRTYDSVYDLLLYYIVLSSTSLLVDPENTILQWREPEDIYREKATQTDRDDDLACEI